MLNIKLPCGVQRHQENDQSVFVLGVPIAAKGYTSFQEPPKFKPMEQSPVSTLRKSRQQDTQTGKLHSEP